MDRLVELARRAFELARDREDQDFTPFVRLREYRSAETEEEAAAFLYDFLTQVMENDSNRGGLFRDSFDSLDQLVDLTNEIQNAFLEYMPPSLDGNLTRDTCSRAYERISNFTNRMREISF